MASFDSYVLHDEVVEIMAVAVAIEDYDLNTRARACVCVSADVWSFVITQYTCSSARNLRFI